MYTMHKCDTCPYFDPDQGEFETHGECHRHAPAPLRRPEPGAPTGWHAPTENWPGTQGSEFCGEHPSNVAQVQLLIAMSIEGATFAEVDE
jgi:hypothetical protein